MISNLKFSLNESLSALWIPILMTRELGRHLVYPHLDQILTELNLCVL